MRRYWVVFLVFLTTLLVMGGCGKREPLPIRTPSPARTTDTAPPDDPVISPTVSVSASPSTIERGNQATLSWQSSNASSIVIDNGVGNVGDQGSIVISPRESTTFTATATGRGGESRSSTRVTVIDARKTDPVVRTDEETLSERIARGEVGDIFFPYDKAELTEEARQILDRNARIFREYPNARIIIEGHCDERGTEEYNLALGDRRALATRDFLLELGVEGSRMQTISFGEERPFDTGTSEASYARNRRAHFTVPGMR